MTSEEESKSVLEEKLTKKSKFAWDVYSDDQKKQVRELAEAYMEFLRNARNERERTTWAIEHATMHGFQLVSLGKDIQTLQPGDKIFYVNKFKNVALVVVGKQSMLDKTHLVGSHIDTPRLDLRINPLIDDKDAGLALFKTHYYGGIKKYQWATVPLHLTGVIVKGDGTKIHIEIGKDPQDPVFTIPDLLIHLSSTVQSTRTMRDIIKAEEMTVLAGGLPIADEKAKEKFKLAVLNLLHEKYGIVE
ncbi:MAG: aminopeptidase, partial [Promethearchaeota archaeon]